MSNYKKSKPIFIVGAHRSATSHLKKCVQEGFDMPGNTEGYIWSNISSLKEKIDYVINVTLNGEKSGLGANFSIKKFGHSRVLESVIKSIDEIHQTELNSIKWIDKTPGPDMIKILPSLNQYFPSAKIIYCIRDCVQNLESRRIRFNNPDLEKPIQNYSNTIINWEEIKDNLNENYIIIDQSNLKSAPEDCAERISKYLEVENNDKFIELLRGKTEKSDREEKSSQEIFDNWTPRNKYHFFKNCFFFKNYNLKFENLYAVNTNTWTSSSWENISDTLLIHPNLHKKVILIFPNIKISEDLKCLVKLKNKTREEKVALRFTFSLRSRDNTEVRTIYLFNRNEIVEAEFLNKEKNDYILEVSCENLTDNIFYNGCDLKVMY